MVTTLEGNSTISTPREKLARSVGEKWTGTYEAYMQSAWWRGNRNSALKRAGFKCQRCGSKNGLEVHHKTYERMGNEWDADLEALCRDCHSKHHVEEASVQRVYLAIVSECLKAERFTCLSDLLEAAKASCAQKHIPYDDRRIWQAVRMADANRRGVLDAPKPPPQLPVPPEGRPPTKQEAYEFCRNILGLVADQFSMPAGPSDCEERARFQANEFAGRSNDDEIIDRLERQRPKRIGRGRFAIVNPINGRKTQG
jgi:hypothetical protein